MRALFVALAVCSLFACQKQEPAASQAATRAGAKSPAPASPATVNAASGAEPILAFNQAGSRVAKGTAAFVPMKNGATFGLAVARTPNFVDVYFQNEDDPRGTKNSPIYVLEGTVNVKDPDGVPLQEVAPDGRLRVTEDLLQGVENAIQQRAVPEADARLHVDRHHALYIQTGDGNPVGGLVYETPEGYTNLYRLEPNYGYRFVEEISPHILMYSSTPPHVLTATAKVSPKRMKTLVARLAQH